MNQKFTPEQMRNHCKKTLDQCRTLYDCIGKVYCPCLNADVFFNAQGFHHFKYHGGGEARTVADILHKIKLFPLVIPVLKQCTSIFEYEKKIEPIGRNSKRPKKEVEYWTVVATVGRNNDVKVKVVLKKTGAGNIIFWSVMRLRK